MPLSPGRIVTQGQTHHPHERDAFEFAVRELPDTDPFRLWAFVDLVDKGGRRYDVDFLILGYHALYVVEVKSHVGTLTGDEVDWKVTFPDGGRTFLENPLRATNHKAKVLASLLAERFSRDPDAQSRNLRPPWVQPLVFLSGPDLKVDLSPAGRMLVVTRETFRRAITHGEFPGATDNLRDRMVNRPIGGATQRVLKELGLRASVASLKVQDLILRELLEDGTHYQDHLGTHQSIANLTRRVRSFVIPANTTTERREQLLRAAGREARHLTALSDHRNILRLVGYATEGPLGGPCIILEHMEGALPLDVFLRANPDLSFEDRIAIIQQIAEALDFCHRKAIIHRGLSPRTVLVRRAQGATTGATPAAPGPIEARLYNFQLASTEDSSGTSHIASEIAVYMAPEALQDPAGANAVSDVFSLGAIAYHVLTGRPPGATLTERAALLVTGKLSVAAVRDDLAGGVTRRSLESPLGAPPTTPDDPDQTRSAEQTRLLTSSLDEVVGFATEENPHQRADSAMAWLNLLLDTATTPVAPTDAPFAHPLQATPGQRLADDLEVVDILGSGSTARVLRVRRDGTDYALKVALSPELEDRVRQEGRVLEALQKKGGSHRIVSLVGQPTLADRTCCLLMSDAGETLSTLIAREGPASLDFARRWGEDLLTALEALEEKGIQHRDIKPANLGVLPGQAKKKRHLLLFDFSLASVADTAITAGTPAYRDPFLDRRGRWDPAADRWAAAMTLHELLTGVRPGWGEGDETAVAADGEIRIASERFDASGNVRPKLTAFFRRALARDVAARFDSADIMRVEWNGCFATLAYTSTADESSPPARAWDFSSVAPETPIAALPLSARAKNALDRAGMTLLSELLRMPRNRLSTTRGIGRHTHQEIERFVTDARTALDGRVLPGEEAAFVEIFSEPSGDLGASPEWQRTGTVARVPGLAVEAVSALEDAGLNTLAATASAPRNQIERVLAPFPGATRLLREYLQSRNFPADASGSTPPGGPQAQPKGKEAQAPQGLGTSPALGSEPAPSSPGTIEGWLEQLLVRNGKREKYLVTAAQLLGLVPPPPAAPAAAPAAGSLAVDDAGLSGAPRPGGYGARELAHVLGVTQAAVHIAFGKAREHWRLHPHLPELHRRVGDILERAGAVAPLGRIAAELASALPHRPSPGGSPPVAAARDLAAEALVRIAAETHPDMVQGRIHGQPWLASGATPLALARELGKRADELALRVPLPSSDEVRAALAPVVGATVLGALPPDRLVALAAEASVRAARSARLELYPRGLEARRALELSASAVAPHLATPEAIRQIVRARYPEAEPPPEGEALHRLMEPLGFRWDAARGSYHRAGSELQESLGTLMQARQSTTHTSHRPAPSNLESQEANEFEARLRLAVDRRSFRVLDVTAGYDTVAADEIARRFRARVVSLEGIVLGELERLTVELEIEPGVIDEADRQGPSASDDWERLRRLMHQAAEAALGRVLGTPPDPQIPVVLTQPGILARYHLDEILGRLVESAQRDDSPSMFLVNPTDDASEWARIDSGTTPLIVPLVSQAQRLKVPEPWIRNWHRGGIA